MKTQLVPSLALPFLLLLVATAGCSRSGDDPAAAGGSAVAALEGTRWVLSSLAGFSAGLPGEPQPVHLLFDAETGRVSGFSGCNNFTGGYTGSSEGSLQFSQMASTRKYCEGRMELEAQFFKTIGSVQTYVIKASTLELRDAAGEVVLTFQKD